MAQGPDRILDSGSPAPIRERGAPAAGYDSHRFGPRAGAPVFPPGNSPGIADGRNSRMDVSQCSVHGRSPFASSWRTWLLRHCQQCDALQVAVTAPLGEVFDHRLVSFGGAPEWGVSGPEAPIRRCEKSPLPRLVFRINEALARAGLGLPPECAVRICGHRRSRRRDPLRPEWHY